MLPNFKLCHKAYSNQNCVVLAQKQTHKSVNRIESLEINSCLYGQLIFDKGGKNIQ